MAGASKFLRLPEEILLLIFTFIYHPWYLDIEIRRNALFECYYEEPKILVMPLPLNAALISTCKLTRRLAREAMLDAFTGLINAQEEHGLDAFEDLMWPAKWVHIEPRVTKLCLPSTKFSLVGSKDFILKLSAIKSVELFENCGLVAVVDDSVAISDEHVVILRDEYLRCGATSFLPEIPSEMPFCCNGGDVELLLHVYFGRAPSRVIPTVDVLFRIGSDSELDVIRKEIRPAGMPVTPSTRLHTLPT